MNKHGSKWISRQLRLAIYHRDGCSCVYCGESLGDEVELTLDHIIPRSVKVDNTPSNLVTACRQCNTVRGDRDFAEFVVAVAMLNKVTVQQVMGHIEKQLALDIKPFLAEAKTIIARSPSWKLALEKAKDYV
jgi:CRISPR/Cas system Type II protein with McrA/HNH and RuvC-like nuclease domain